MAIGTMPFKTTEIAIRRSRTIVIRIIKFWKIDPEAIGMVTVDECITKSKPKLTAVVTRTTDRFLSNHAQMSEVRSPRRSFDDPGILEDLMLIFRGITYKDLFFQIQILSSLFLFIKSLLHVFAEVLIIFMPQAKASQ
jgi:hypothetical protein